jgi:hypothetical protein
MDAYVRDALRNGPAIKAAKKRAVNGGNSKRAGAPRNAPAADLLGGVVHLAVGSAAWLAIAVIGGKAVKGVLARNSVVLQGRVLNSTRPGEADIRCLIDTGALHFHVVSVWVSPPGTSSSTGKHPKATGTMAGATINVCYPDVIERLGVPKQSCERMPSAGVEGATFYITEYVEVHLLLDGKYHCPVKAYVMPEGTKSRDDFILGMPWLRSLGRSNFNPVERSIEFTHQNSLVKLRAKRWWQQ